MNNLKKILLNKLPEFKDYTLNFLNGNMSKTQYETFSKSYGVYAQRNQNSFMINLRTSCGTISKCQLHTIYQFAHSYGLDYIYLSTRQCIQLHNLDMDTLINIMEKCIHKDIFTIGCGGDFPRNIGLSPLSGVDIEESFDVTAYAIATDKYFLNKINLPTKFKVFFANSYRDSFLAAIQDLGFVAVLKNDISYFQVYVGGCFGKNPRLGLKVPYLIDPSNILYYVEGLTKLLIQNINCHNKQKTRIRYLIEKFGEEEFMNIFLKYVEQEKKNTYLKIKPKKINYSKEEIKIHSNNPRLINQKQVGLYTIRIQPLEGIYKLKDLKSLLSTLDKIKNPIIRIGLMQEIYILNLDGNEAKKVLEITENVNRYS